MTPPLALYVGPGDTGDLVQQPDAVTFLAARWLHNPGPRVTGRGADALAAYGFGAGGRPDLRDEDFPDDADDLAACERTYLMAPDDVRERMLPVLVEYREHVAGRGQR